MEDSPRLPGVRQTSEQHPLVVRACRRPKVEEHLPLDVLEIVMGYLDRETLYTARLVSRSFCAAASALPTTVKLKSTSRAVSFQRFPRVRDVAVTHYCEEGSLAELNPRLRNLVTTLEVENSRGSVSDALAHVALMPRLRQLTAWYHVNHVAAVLPLCTALECIEIGRCGIPVAMAVVTMTRLTSLSLCTVYKDGDRGAYTPIDSSWFRHATNLRKLEALTLIVTEDALPLVGNLTGLTGLTVMDDEAAFWERGEDEEEPVINFTPLTRLTRLRSLWFFGYWSEENVRIACSLGSGRLVNLQLWGDGQASADLGRCLTQQTALTWLRLDGQGLCDWRYIGALRVELLRSLELHALPDALDDAGISALGRATGLTRLVMNMPNHMGISGALARLTGLRSLGLNPCGVRTGGITLEFCQAFSPLTALTKLKLSWFHLANEDLRALLVLTGLRVLHISSCRLTHEVVPEFVVLTNLSSLDFSECGIASLAPVTEVLNPLREARGLPPMTAIVERFRRR